jgi:hypothetical protein
MTASRPWLMLISRSALFVLFQLLIALILFASGAANAWDESTRYWTFLAFLANFASLYLLIRVYKAEGKNFWDTLRLSRAAWKTDLLWFIGFSVIGLPIAAGPREPLAAAIFGDVTIATDLLFQPLPAWAFVLSFLFPLTIWFAELPTYFGYCMPRLEAQLKNGWVAWLIASFFLAAQHIFLPTIFNGGYMLWRFGMFFPFALVTGLALKFRPTLLPYFVVVHALMDITTVLVYLMI